MRWRHIAFIGIDIGGTKVALHLVGAEHGELLAEFSWPGAGSCADDIEHLSEFVRASRTRARSSESLEGVGVAMPATVDASGRVVAWPNRQSWIGLDLAACWQSLFPGVTVRWADDGDLAALAEAHEVGCRDLVYVGVGTGVGGGIVLDGRLCPGTARGSCEIGHVIVDRSGPRCTCGRRGCVQALASGPAILARAKRRRGAPASVEELRTALRREEPWATTTLRRGAQALAAAIVSVSELVHPSLAVIGGGFAAALPAIVPAAAAEVAALARTGHPVPAVRPAALGPASSLRGALLLAQGIG